MKRAKILSASAGSGKTYQLAYKYVRDVVERPELYRAILAVTFTNKATEEMKSRILREIHILASGQKSAYMTNLCSELGMSEQAVRKQAMRARTLILHDYSRFSILTIDKFFQRIIRAFIKELGIDLNYNIELDPTQLLSRSADSLVEKISTNEELKQWMLEFAKERIDDGTRWDMRGDLRALGQEIFKESSRQRTSLSKSKHDLGNIVSKAMAEAAVAKDTLQKLGQSAVEIIASYPGLSADMFAGKSRSFVYRFYKYADGDMSEPTTKMVAAANDIDEWYGKNPDAIVSEAAAKLQPLLKEICDSYSQIMKRVNTAKLLHSNYRSFALLADLSQQVEDICREENIMVLGETKHILSTFVDGSNAPFIYEKVGNRFERFMIDEFQDTSVREWKNMLPLLQNAMSESEECSVLIVGDVKQSIYRWRGGDWRLLQSGAIEDLGAGDVQVEQLEHNFRSLEKIIDFNREVIDAVVATDNQYLNNIVDTALSNKEISESLHSSLHNIVATAYNKHKQLLGRKYDDEGYAEMCFYDTALEDSPFIEVIEDAIARGYKYRDILILVRGKSDGNKVAERLLEYKDKRFTVNNEVGFNILTSDSLTIENSEITQFIIAVFRLAIDLSNDVERGVYNRFLAKPLDHNFDDEERAFFTHIAHLSPMEAFEDVVMRFKLYDHKSSIAYLQALHEGVVSFSTSRIADLQHYLKWWDEKGKNDVLSVEMTDDTIEISTVHKAKGLERDVVIIPYCKWDTAPKASMQPIVWSQADGGDVASIGEFPVVYGKSMQNSAFTQDYYSELVMSHVDAVNLLYVALTRASKELYVMVPSALNTKSKSSDVINTIVPLLTVAAQTRFPDYEQLSDVDGIHRKIHRSGTKLRIGSRGDVVESGNLVLDDYTSYKPNVMVRYPSRRFVDEQVDLSNTPQSMGVRLHRIFEGATTFDELCSNLRRMESSALISPAEAQDLRTKIDSIVENELVSEWFTGEWDDVKCESEILLRGDVYRPDRVMISGRRAVVIDYKFGNQTNVQYRRQVCKYINLLKQMDLYDQVEGYIWYVSLGEVDKVV
ncbi:MAG: UvrD-helicase domain-containing protein [Alistipes sp.]|nr:UvrD-helicase domain-containing protein [Alistipes sp.]